MQQVISNDFNLKNKKCELLVNPENISKLPEIKFYNNRENKTLNILLFNDIANKCACYVAHTKNKENKYFRNNKNKSTQLRKFYDYTIEYINLLTISNDTKYQEDVFSEFFKIVSLVAYNLNRNQPTIDDRFKDFILCSLEQVKDIEDLKVFGSFFESFIGFYMLYNK